MDQPRPPRIQMGMHEVDTWYSGCYPLEYSDNDKTLMVCEFCLSYMLDEQCLAKHNLKCPKICPAGNEIYRCTHDIKHPIQLSVFEVDGYKAKQYCQNLCFLGKLFIDQKTLCYDVEHFLFYVLTLNDEIGFRIIGYFSKEKHSRYKHNVSCILVLPQYQGYGYGSYLIEFSYLLSKQENQPGSPEKPLSKLGLLCYLKYWKTAILDVIKDKKQVSIREICEETYMTAEDVNFALIHSNMMRDGNIYITKQDIYMINRPRLRVQSEHLRWTRFISHYNKDEKDDDDEEVDQTIREIVGKVCLIEFEMDDQ